MPLVDYYFDDPRLILIPIEQLTPQGMRPEFAAALAAARVVGRRTHPPLQRRLCAVLGRSASLAARTRTWAPPRLRHVGVVIPPLGVRRTCSC